MSFIELPGLESTQTEPQFIEFGRDGKVFFRLPVLGSPGVPIGIMSAFSMFWDRMQSGSKITERETSSAWNLLIHTLADAYPDATRGLARLDEPNLKHVFEHWVTESQRLGGFDPKAAAS